MIDLRSLEDSGRLSHEDILYIVQLMLDKCGARISAEDFEAKYIRDYGEEDGEELLLAGLATWLQVQGYSVAMLEVSLSI